jgi:light-regulated signal transduction histidine kinase (bacteriophytochrome)
MVSSYTQLLASRYKGRLDDDADEFIAFAVDAASRMHALIDDLLSFSRVGADVTSFESLDCNAVLAQALANLAATIVENDASVTHDELPTVEANATQLTQVFQNLIANAIKFRQKAPPSVHVACRLDGSVWVFSVRDNGIGIESEYAERIFTIFQRLHTREEYPGTGIGLAVCKKIVERHGGTIWMRSKPGEGTTFYFTLSNRGNNDDYS